MAETFAQLWNRVLLYAPGVPVPIVQQAVKNAYKRAMDMHYWSELFGDRKITIGTEISTGTLSVANATVTATGDGSVDFTTEVGRTIKIGDTPDYYTITAVATDSVTLTLDRAYYGTTSTAESYNVADYYVKFPADLGVLDGVRDYSNTWKLKPQQLTQGYIDRVDPQRTHTGTPVMMAAAPVVEIAGTQYPRYEFWPRPPAGTEVLYRYQRSHELVNGTDEILEALKPEAVLYGALSELALWPGTADRPNPFFSMDLHKSYTKLFEEAVHDSEMSDLDRAQRMILSDDENFGFPSDANWLQAHGIPF